MACALTRRYAEIKCALGEIKNGNENPDVLQARNSWLMLAVAFEEISTPIRLPHFIRYPVGLDSRVVVFATKVLDANLIP